MGSDQLSGSRTSYETRCCLSIPNAALVIKKAWNIGRVHVTDHFRKRGIERRFDPLDAGNAIRQGRIIGPAEFSTVFRNWKYRVRGPVEDSELELVLGLDASEDYAQCPLVILITGFWKE
jgi:hypothetical protein